jgi:hypothetical protein
MLENEITGDILHVCIQIHRDLGPSLFESIYEEFLHKNLKSWDMV